MILIPLLRVLGILIRRALSMIFDCQNPDPVLSHTNLWSWFSNYFYIVVTSHRHKYNIKTIIMFWYLKKMSGWYSCCVEEAFTCMCMCLNAYAHKLVCLKTQTWHLSFVIFFCWKIPASTQLICYMYD